MRAYYFKRASDWIQGIRYYWKAYLIIWIVRITHSQVLKNLLNGGKLYEIHFLGIWKKYLGLVSFWAPLKGYFWIFQKQGHCFYEVLYFPFLTPLVWRQNVQKLFAAVFLKTGVLKNLHSSQESTCVGVSF